MAIFAIGDLHLGFSSDKPMCIFGENWKNHHEKIQKNWLENITCDDTVLIAGDTSWAMNIEGARPDMEWIASLPGKKIICKGNHDFWWTSTSKVRSAFSEFEFIFNSFSAVEGIAVCGSRGWICPTSTELQADGLQRSSELNHDIKVYQRELVRLGTSLDAARIAGYEDIIAMLHFPPTNERKERSGFIRLFHEYGVKRVIYGHLHGEHSFGFSIAGVHEGIDYKPVSCDYLDFKPVKLV